MKKIFLILAWTLLVLSSCGKTNTTDIINPDADFLYFYGATCPHCQDLNSKMEEQDIFSKVSIEKREVYFNNSNHQRFLIEAKKLWLDPEKTWVPFALHKASKTHAIGVEPVLKLFLNPPKILPTEIQNEQEKEEYTGPIWLTNLNENADFVYYHGQSIEWWQKCKACEELEVVMLAQGYYDIYSIEKREVYYNKENGRHFMKLHDDYEIPKSHLSPPFMYHKATGKYAFGAEQILSLIEDTDNFILDTSGVEELDPNRITLTETIDTPDGVVEKTQSEE